MSDKDYLAAYVVEEGDRLDYGVKGMKWGLRRSKAELAAAPSGGSSTPSTTKAPAGGDESAAQRYSRLASAAKAGKGNQLSDEDLKFFNARTEALAKVAKLNESNPGWLKATTKKVIQQTAQKQMQTISDEIASKFISDRIKTKIGREAVKEAAKAAT